MSSLALGMDLRGCFSQAVLGETNPTGEFRAKSGWHAPAPNVCVLPRFRGERPRANWLAIRSHWGRGSTLFSRDAGGDILCRVPGWLIWLGLQSDALEPSLDHTHADGSKGRIALHRMLAALLRELQSARTASAHEAQPDPPQRYVVAMPDHFQERGQETLFDALPYQRDECRLLWSSVAICLAWIASLPWPDAPRYAAKRVAVVEMGVAEVSATVLELRTRPLGDRLLLVPKRDLPEEGSSQFWHMLPFDLCLAAEWLKEIPCAPTLREVWQAATGGLTGLLRLPPAELPEAATLIETPQGWHRLAPLAERLGEVLWAAAQCRQIPGLDDLRGAIDEVQLLLGAKNSFPERSLADAIQRDVVDWIRSRPARPDLILLAGPVAALSIGAGETLGSRLADALQQALGRPTLAPGRDFDPTQVNAACGCAVYGGRELAGLPTYFDTLPRFCIVGKDRLRWQDKEYDLVPHKECEGGKEYRPSPEERERLKNAAMIPKGRRSVRFRLKRQNQEKHLEQTFERAPLRDCYLSFDVVLRPAQGFARVYITAEQPNFFPGGRVLLDWKRMKDAQLEEDKPPDFPTCEPLAPRKGSVISEFKLRALEEFSQAVQQGNWREASTLLDPIGKALGSGAALGSHPRGWPIERFLEDIGIYHRRVPQELISSESVHKDLVRAASALFNRAPSWAIEMIAAEFRKARACSPHDPNPPLLFVVAAGRCFRFQPEIRLFTECFVRHLQARMNRWKQRKQAPGMNHWCKAFQLILRLNDEAVLWIERNQAEGIAQELANLLEATQPAGEVIRLPYLHAMLSVYYLLRFRARPDGLEFLTDWDKPSTAAWRIHQNLSRHQNARPRQERWLSPPEGPTVQSALLHFLESKATAQDIVIMKEADDAAVLEGAQDE